MDNIQKLDIVGIELNNGTMHRSWLNHSIGTGDNKANRFGMRVFRDGQPVNLGGASVQGYFRNSRGTNIAITTGAISGNLAYVILPQACYNYEGLFTLAIKVIGDGVTETMRIVDGMVDNTNSGNAVAPTGTVPTYQEVMAVYNQMVEAKNGVVRFDIEQTLTENQMARARANTKSASEGIQAQEYDTIVQPIEVGTYCLHNGVLYCSTTRITDDASWTASHWKQCTTTGEIKELKDIMLNSMSEERKTNGIRSIKDFVYGGVVNGYSFPLQLNDVKTRIRTKGFLQVNYGDTVVINPGSYRFAVWQWSGNPYEGAVVINRNWSTTTLTFVVPTTTDFILITFADKTDTTATISLSDFDGTITITPYEQKQISELEKMLNATRINTNTDLNTIITPGYYTLMSNYSYNNLPTGAVGSAGVLLETNDPSINWQFLFAVNYGKIFSRYKGISGNWGAWVDYIPEYNPETDQKKSISILFVGNSLTQDGIAYLPYLLKTYYPQIDFKIYMWYNGGYTLEQQYNSFVNNDPCQIFSVAENRASWTNFNNSKTMASILTTYKFDIVSIQEYFNYKQTYTDTDLSDWNNCKDYITSHYTGGNGLKYITLFHAPLRSNATNVFNLTKNGIKLTLQKTICEDMIPTGISIFRALSTDLDNLGDQRHLSPDGTHTQEGLPCLIQTYVALQWVLDKLSIPKSIYGFPFKMTTSIYNTINVPGPNLGTGVIVGTDAENLLAQEVAIKAYKEGKQFVVYNEHSES